MMNAAMDRWGVASSSIYNNLNKESDSKKSNSNDSKKKQRKPLPQKEKQKQQQKDSKSYSDGSSSNGGSNGKGSSKWQSGAAAQILATETTETELNDEDFDDILPPPIHSVVQNNEQDMNDVSTIAGDTFAGIEMDASVAEAVPPHYHQLGVDTSPYDSAYDIPMPLAPGALGQTMDGAMITPTYSVLRQEKKSRRRVFSPNKDDHDDDDQSTLPESPDNNNNEDEYGFVEEGKPSKSRRSLSKKKKETGDKKQKSFSSDDDDEDQPSLPRFEGDKKFEPKAKDAPRRRRFRCMMCMGSFLAFLLLLGIASLGYTLYAIRNEDKGAVSMFTKEFWTNAGTKLAFWKKNNDDEEAVDDVDFRGTVAPSHPYTHWSNTSTSTYAPTQLDSNAAPVIDSPQMEEIRSIVLSATIEKSIPGINGTALNDPASMQYDVMQWLSFDALFDTYSEEKILQRYALGCFYESIMMGNNEEMIDTSNDPNSDAVRSTWMGYGDECTEWASTEANSNNNDKKQTCNENGQVHSIHLENVGLTGTLAPELALLSDSLQSLYLTKNKIHGTIPLAYGKMTSLKRLQLSRNSLEGTLNGPDLLGPLVKLEIIGLGGNKLSGPLPEQLGYMPNMIYINIPYNDFTGSIPSTWGGGVTGEASKLKHVSLAMNELTGTVPDELAAIESLDNLFLTGNNLFGSVPSFVCTSGVAFGVDVANVTDTNTTTNTNVTYNAMNNITYNDMKMTVDCESVSCSCCGCNGVIPPPFTEVAGGVAIDARAESSNISTTVATNNTSIIEGTTVPSVVSDDTVVDANNTVSVTEVDSSFTNEDSSFFGFANGFGTNGNNGPGVAVDISTSIEDTPLFGNAVGSTDNVVDSSTTDEGTTTSVGSDTIVDNVVGADSNVPEASVVTTEASDSNTPDASGAAPTTIEQPESSFPFVDDASMNEMIEVLNGTLPASAATNRYGCQTINVGFRCYTSGWSIDFELSNSGCAQDSSSPTLTTEEYDLVALYPYEGDINAQAPSSNVGSLKSLEDSMYWATSCGLAECDGVVANGQVYYRNTYPKQTASLSQAWWPVASGSMMQVQWMRSDASGTAIVLAESQPFLVSNTCQ